MKTTLPSLSQPAVDPKTGFFSTAWIGFFSQLLGMPSALQPVTVGPSPFAWTAPGAGTLVMAGGSVTGVTLTRGRMTASASAGALPVGQGDVVTVTYTTAPATTFVPS